MTEPTSDLDSRRMSTGEISGSHGGEYESDRLLECCTVLSGINLPKFHSCLAPPVSGR
jgi:hypothetical protein